MSDAWRIAFARTGGPDVLERQAMTLAPPGPDEILVRNEAIGVNFIDVYRRTGLYPLALPSGLGSEGGGIVEAVGANVDTFAVGQRVGYLLNGVGAYATHVIVRASEAFVLPEGIDGATAAASLLKGITAWMLAERIAQAEAGRTILVHAAAGGVGSILVQWLKALDATVIAHAGTPAKAAQAQALGADHALSCPFDTLAADVRRLTDGRGADAVLDGVGQASWAASLGAVAKRGVIASYGNASGPVPPISPLDLLRAGSIFLTRPTLFDYIDTADARTQAAARLFALIASGRVKVPIGQRFALADAAAAHRALEGRTTTGSTILVP